MLEAAQRVLEQDSEPNGSQCDNRAALEFVYQHYRQLVFRICLRILRDPVEAEDAAQDVFVHLLLKMHTFRGDAAFSSWLYRLTTNVVLMRLRKHDRNWISLSDFGDGQETHDGDAKAADPRLNGFVDRIDIQTAVDLLAAGHRSVFILHDVQGYRHKEIAQRLGHSIGNSKSQLHKARRRLRNLLSRNSNADCISNRHKTM